MRTFWPVVFVALAGMNLTNLWERKDDELTGWGTVVGCMIAADLFVLCAFYTISGLIGS